MEQLLDYIKHIMLERQDLFETSKFPMYYLILVT